MQTMKNLLNTTGQRVRRVFERLDRRLKSSDEKDTFIISLTGGQLGGHGQRRKRRDPNRQSANERVAPYTSPSNKPL